GQGARDESRHQPDKGERAPGVFGRWSTWAIAAGGFAAIGVGSVVLASNARSEIQTLNATSGGREFAEAEAVQSRFDRDQWIARIAFGGAIGAVIVGVVLYARGDDSGAPAPRADAPLAWSWTW